ncbi:N-acetylneuraminate synthase family protein [uncultured Aquabacterium sp.]|uniref:N-acetylneuraminate synthase family protein n=1 Tax=uncultured Aquabacterium sp. TaxID=158753 RepID=UPI0025CBABF3|nr:N-acetylneuraminate synthase family protein [uncultured Aquabacterium sp.]
MDNFSTLLNDIASIYSTDTIYIVGKGPSVDDVRPEVYQGSLVIGINDAERIVPADITVFHGEWVERGLAESQFRSRLYVASHEFDAKGKKVHVAPHVPLTQASSDLIMQRFMSDDLVIEDVLFLTALKIARKVAELKGRQQTVYMVGFDFNAGVGLSQKLGKDFAPQDAEETALRISVQEFYFVNTLYFLRDSLLNLKHVGGRSFSALTPSELNASLPHASTRPDSPNRVSIVAELTTNHFGDRTRLERMIRASKAAGADFIKLQKRDVAGFYTPEQLASPYVSPFGKTFADYRYQLELSKEDFLFVDQLCNEVGIGWFASVLDQVSFEFMQDLNPAMVKLPSTISEHTDYLKYVADTYDGAVVLSTGMTDAEYENFVLENFSKCSQLYLLQCNSAYPTPLHDCNVGVVRHYHDLSLKHDRIIPGYSSHDFGWKASALAVAAGARMLEKHVKLGNTEWAHFDAVAVDLTTPAFKEYVDNIRETEMIVGESEKRINESEHHKYRRG